MNVLYDYQSFTMQSYGGVSKCFCELISHLPHDIIGRIGVCETNNIHLHSTKLIPNLSNSVFNQYNFITSHPFRGKVRLYKLLNKCCPFFPSEDNRNRRYSIDLLRQGNFEVFHPTFFDDYFLPYLGNKPFVLTIHDMMPELFPQYFKRDDFQIVKKRKLVEKAAAIIVVSEQTKYDVMRLLGVPEDKIFVIYHGGPEIKSVLCKKPIVKSPYFLYVGTRDAYKNFPLMLRGFARFVTLNSDVKLVCTGSPFSKSERRQIAELRMQNSIIQLSVDDQDLSNLYSHAIAFVYPSLYEGFGMPILEAFAHNCPVILSRCSCFPEIAGDAAVYFDSSSSKDLSQKLDFIWSMDMQQKAVLVEAGRKRLSCFSWEKSAHKLSDIYRNIGVRK